MQWINKRPVQLAILVGILNMELVVIPIILKVALGFEGTDLKIAATIWATSEIYFWYWFSGWLLFKLKESREGKEAIKIGKKVIPEVRGADFYYRAERWVKKNIIDRFNPDKYEKRIFYLLLKGCGYIFSLPMFFFLGLIPTMLIFGIIATRIKNWKLGFWFLITGNVVKNIGFAEGWDYIWLLFGKI